MGLATMLAWIQGGGSAAAGGAEEAPDLQGMLMHHLLDGSELEFQIFGVGPIIHLDRFHIPPIHLGGLTIDLSPTKHVVFLLLAAIVCLAVFLPLARTARSAPKDRAPTGLANAMEGLILYFRDEVVRRNIGHGADAYTGYILTLFFFILSMNVLGLLPFGATPTGNFMVTGALALITLLVVEISGMRALGFKGYMRTIFFVPHGLNPAMSVIMLVILTPVELLGKIAKPFALMVRLFANMMAGHTLVLSLLGLIFMFASAGFVVVNGVAVASVAMVTAIMMLEIFVAFLQAYIFAMLTAVFIGLIRHAH
ncbi:MAG: F0F1 ATP synthase subunit A [Gemmatimonadota bacterium]